MTPLFNRNAKPMEAYAPLQPMDREQERFWQLRRERLAATKEQPQPAAVALVGGRKRNSP